MIIKNDAGKNMTKSAVALAKNKSLKSLLKKTELLD